LEILHQIRIRSEGKTSSTCPRCCRHEKRIQRPRSRDGPVDLSVSDDTEKQAVYFPRRDLLLIGPVVLLCIFVERMSILGGQQ
jgi:hypothetical protein